MITAVLECGLDAVFAFPDDVVRKPHGCKIRQSGGQIDLNLDEEGLDTQKTESENLGNQWSQS
jgi:hypothetical protein